MTDDASEPTRVDAGLLVLRVGIGLMFLTAHGGPKLLGGPERWEQVGAAMGLFGIQFAPVYWGFLAACAEGVGGLCLLLGLFTRPAATFMAITMAVATATHLSRGDGLQGASHAIEMGIVFVSLLLAGAGAYSLDRNWFGIGGAPKGAPFRYSLPR